MEYNVSVNRSNNCLKQSKKPHKDLFIIHYKKELGIFMAGITKTLVCHPRMILHELNQGTTTQLNFSIRIFARSIQCRNLIGN